MSRHVRDPFAEQQEVTIRLLRLLEAAVCGAAQFIVDQAAIHADEQEEREANERRIRRRRAERRAEREADGTAEDADTGATRYSDDGIPWNIIRCEPPVPGELAAPVAEPAAEEEAPAEEPPAEEEPAAPAQLEPVPPGTLLRLIPELPADHEAQASYRELAERLRTLADLAVEHPSEALAQRVTEVWQSFQAFNRFKISDPERYPAIRDYLRGTIKPFCSRIIADCAEGSAG